MQIGIGASVGHPENGMPISDMRACMRAAAVLDEIIVFRSTGPWSKRWLATNPPYPSKNFHVKGKSSDWGPQAGFVPELGQYSKVGYDVAKAAKGTGENKKGIASGFAIAIPLSLSRDEIEMQLKQPCELPARTALLEIVPVGDEGALLLGTIRSGDNVRVNFIAVPNAGRFDIMLPPEGPVWSHKDLLIDRIKSKKLDPKTLQPLRVMASNEVGAGQQAMTGDYDLMAICPRWNDYGARSTAAISKPAIALNPGVHAAVPMGKTFAAGSALDKPMDMRLHTGARTDDKKQRLLPVNGGEARFRGPENFNEHGDMGNLTPRILRAIVMLNVEMGAVGPNAALRRVHHNAESHRHAAFGALVARDMENNGDGFPLTAFHPPSALKGPNSLGRYGGVCTIERMSEFRAYAGDVHKAGFYVPKHWAWNMSVRQG